MTDPVEDPPPLLGSWRNLYVLVVGFLALQVLVYWALTVLYS
ncbi:MAG: hypothetical protein R3F61_36795 [Myxococcota bacterium]